MNNRKSTIVILIILFTTTIIISYNNFNKIYNQKIIYKLNIIEKNKKLEKKKNNQYKKIKEINNEINNINKNIKKLTENKIALENKLKDKEEVENGKVIYLTFDDGPSKYTDDILNILDKYNVKVIGVQVDSIERGEDRIEFKKTMDELGIEMARSEVAYSVEDGLKIADKLGYPVVLRPAYTMGGAGGGLVYNKEELKTVIARGLQASLVGQVLVEESILGWEESEKLLLEIADLL